MKRSLCISISISIDMNTAEIYLYLIEKDSMNMSKPLSERCEIVRISTCVGYNKARDALNSANRAISLPSFIYIHSSVTN